MKKISVVIPCYNEEENIGSMAETLVGLFRHKLTVYDYELIFIGSDSQDRTREYLRALCTEDHKIKAVFNAKNFEQFNSPHYGMLQSTGDTTVLMAADFQDPPEMTVKCVMAWEKGYRIAVGIKTHSTEDPLMYHLRSLYYKWIRKFSEVDQIEHFTGSGLYDKGLIQVLRDLSDPMPFLRGIVAKLSYHREEIPCDQPKRRTGKTGNNLYKLYDTAMLSVASYTRFGLRLAASLDGIALVANVVIAPTYFMMELLYQNRFWAGFAPLLIDMLFLGTVQIFPIDMVGECVLTINQRVAERPLVVETERLNFESEDAEEAR